jgi:hypothetical protein
VHPAPVESRSGALSVQTRDGRPEVDAPLRHPGGANQGCHSIVQQTRLDKLSLTAGIGDRKVTCLFGESRLLKHN